jgi:large subunit ribosomal protein L7/L12
MKIRDLFYKVSNFYNFLLLNDPSILIYYCKKNDSNIIYFQLNKFDLLFYVKQDDDSKISSYYDFDNNTYKIEFNKAIMNEKLTTIIEQLKTLTLLEASELVKAIETTFGVDTSVASAPVAMVGGAAAAPAEAVEEKVAFDITLTEVPADKKIAILKIVRNVTGLGLKESKEIVDNVPKLLKEGVTKAESETMKKELEAAGAKVTVK